MSFALGLTPLDINITIVRSRIDLLIKRIPAGVAASTLAMGFPKGRGAALPFGQGRGSYPAREVY